MFPQPDLIDALLEFQQAHERGGLMDSRTRKRVIATIVSALAEELRDSMGMAIYEETEDKFIDIYKKFPEHWTVNEDD